MVFVVNGNSILCLLVTLVIFVCTGLGISFLFLSVFYIFLSSIRATVGLFFRRMVLCSLVLIGMESFFVVKVFKCLVSKTTLFLDSSAVLKTVFKAKKPSRKAAAILVYLSQSGTIFRSFFSFKAAWIFDKVCALGSVSKSLNHSWKNLSMFFLFSFCRWFEFNFL